MFVRWSILMACSAIAFVTVPAWAQSVEPPATVRTARTVVYRPRDLVSLRAKLHYTTLVVLPEGEDVVEATCGDKEFWIINVRGALVSVKPARSGSETNLNVVTASGQLYAFVLSEISSTKGEDPDLTVYLELDHPSATAPSRVKPQWVPAQELDDFKAQAALARDDARRATEAARTALEKGATDFRNSYPLNLSFSYRFKTEKAPFFVRAIFHDDHRTFIQARAPELPSLYELKDGRPHLVNFDVHDGTYIVPKILDSGYLMLGAQRMPFERTNAR
jgi:type IV secretory pathway VirB9-like protein